MGAPGCHARKPGTGQVRVSKGRFLALEPRRPGEKRERRIGSFLTRWAAERALDQWLAGRPLSVP